MQFLNARNVLFQTEEDYIPGTILHFFPAAYLFISLIPFSKVYVAYAKDSIFRFCPPPPLYTSQDLVQRKY